MNLEKATLLARYFEIFLDSKYDAFYGLRHGTGSGAGHQT